MRPFRVLTRVGRQRLVQCGVTRDLFRDVRRDRGVGGGGERVRVGAEMIRERHRAQRVADELGGFRGGTVLDDQIRRQHADRE